MSKKLTIGYIKEDFNSHGYVLLTTTYINSATPLKYICPEGHEYQVTWNKWKLGRRCPFCNPKGRVRKRTFEDVSALFSKEGYTLLTHAYSNCSEKLEYICPNGHRYSTSLDDWMSKGSRCAICSNNARLTTGKVASILALEGYELLNKYKNASTDLELKCPKGHIRNMAWANWSSGNRCCECAGKVKHSIEFIKEEFSKVGYVLITDYYDNGKQKLKYKCDNGHINYVNWNNFSQGNRCPDCSYTGRSRAEQELASEINLFGFDVLTNSKNIINPYELDIVIPEKKLAIEYCGLYWHSELMNKDRKYHLNKLEMCEKAGYTLITVFEDEWIKNKDIVISRLSNLLHNREMNTIYARKCTISEIPVAMARTFCDDNHTQSYTGSSIKLGAFFKDELVSVMTFSKLSIAKGFRHSKKDCWELSRFCSKAGYRVIGVASKLLKYFERNYNWEFIVSYADRRWSVGNLYNKLGFTFEHNTRPNYWYFKDNTKRIHRFALRKNSDDPKNTTEWNIRKSQGWNRIWDCGNLKFIKNRMEKIKWQKSM